LQLGRFMALGIDVKILISRSDELVTLIPKGAKISRGFTWIKNETDRNNLFQKNLRNALNTVVSPAWERCLKTKEFHFFSNHAFDNTTNDPSRSIEVPHNDVHVYAGGLPFELNTHEPINWADWVPPEHPIPNSRLSLEQTEIFYLLTQRSPGAANFFASQWNLPEAPRAFYWIQILSICLPWEEKALSVVDSAGFDPLFYFHHTNVDRFYWQWQEINNPEHWEAPSPLPNPGTPNPWIASGIRGLENRTVLSLMTPLHPFGLMSAQVLKTEAFGYTYPPVTQFHHKKAARVYPVTFNKLNFTGQVIVYLFERDKGQKYLVGSHYAFTRIDSQTCINCQTNPWITVWVPYEPRPGIAKDSLDLEVFIEGKHYESPKF